MRKVSITFGLAALALSTGLRAEPAPVEDLGQPAELQRPNDNYYSQNDNDNTVNNSDEADNNQTDQYERERRPSPQAWNERENQQDEDGQLSTEQRLSKVEQQIDNTNKLNLSTRIEQLQDEINQLRGQIDKQAHDLQLLAVQQKQFYQDLSARISQQKPGQVANNSLPADINTAVNTPSKSDTISANESQSYREAFDLLKSKQYDQAIGAFQRYLVRYPAGHYAVNGNYWLGEIYYLQGRSLEAKKAFTSVVKNYPNSQKMPDALLKLAIIEIEAGNKNEGQRLLEQVQQQYPGTTAARLAALRYQELRLSS